MKISKFSNFRVCIGFYITTLILLESIPGTKSQSTLLQQRILLQLQKQLEYPNTLVSWQEWTNFCYLPPSPNVTIICTSDHITELTIIGNKNTPQQKLSRKFSIDSLFTVLTKLERLKKLSLISLGIWGSIPSKIDRFNSLKMINFSSNFISGEIPVQISSITSLTTLALSNNLIIGNIPDLSTLQSLQQLDVSNNKIGPNLPGLPRNLVAISLRNNIIRSSILETLQNMNKLEKIDISSNNLVGPFPTLMLSSSKLWYLNLSDNKLTGELGISTECGKRLWLVDISRNLLSGKLPKCIGSDSVKYRKVFSEWNCFSGSEFQYSRKFCLRQAIAVIPPKKKVVKDDEKRISVIKLGAVLGVVFGILLVFGSVCSLIWVALKKRRDCVESVDCKDGKFVGVKLPSRPSPVVETTKYVAKSIRMPTIDLPPYHSFTLQELQQATNNFDQINLLSEDLLGQVYRGLLASGSSVIIRSTNLKEKHSSKNMNKNKNIDLLSQLRHQNLVSVLGHCNKGSTEIYIVFENVVNGSLREHLCDWKRKDRLKWPQRMTISMGIARGVEFLHKGMMDGVLGNDLKMENVFLDESLVPKVGNYRLPLPFKVENRIGQHDSTTKNPVKEDIYKLGIIMLELLTGKQITSENQIDELKLQLEISLGESPSGLQKVIDKAMRGTFAYQSVKTVAQITVNCLNKEPSERPRMEDVVWHLEYSIQAQQAWTTSGNLALNSGNLSLIK